MFKALILQAQHNLSDAKMELMIRERSCWHCQVNEVSASGKMRQRSWMSRISYARHRFPPVIIQNAVWLYTRFSLSYRDVEDLLAERGLDISYEAIRSWVIKFGQLYARNLRRG